MSRRSKREKRKRKLQAQASKPLPAAASGAIATTTNNNLATLEAALSRKEGIICWVRNHKTTSVFFGIFVFSLGGPLNFYGSSPQIFYLPALAASLLISWLLLGATYRFIQTQILIRGQQSRMRFRLLFVPVIVFCAFISFELCSGIRKHVHSMGGPPGYIAGTRVTHSVLKDMFPFGYVLFLSRDGTLTYQIEKSEQLRISASWDKTIIQPNFTAKTVYWSLKDFKAEKIAADGEPLILINVDELTQAKVPFEFGTLFRYGVMTFLSEPMPVVGVIGGTQRSPIYVLGFRILTKEQFQTKVVGRLPVPERF